jgi:hypothetical protein
MDFDSAVSKLMRFFWVAKLVQNINHTQGTDNKIAPKQLISSHLQNLR